MGGHKLAMMLQYNSIKTEICLKFQKLEYLGVEASTPPTPGWSSGTMDKLLPRLPQADLVVPWTNFYPAYPRLVQWYHGQASTPPTPDWSSGTMDKFYPAYPRLV